jgi:hypothetical protein
MIALHSLVQATRTLGVLPGVEVPVVRELVVGFVEAVKVMEGWSGLNEAAAMQGAFDVGFLALIGGEKFEGDIMVQKLLQKVCRYAGKQRLGKLKVL